MNWESFWNRFPQQFDRDDFARQVLYTIGGKPISDVEIMHFSEKARAILKLDKKDAVLDLCCGNGLITQRIAEHCQRVVGVDFSATLIERAKSFKARDNIIYECDDALRFLCRPETVEANFDKLLMHGALQYFQPKDFPRLVSGIKAVLARDGMAFIGGVPDRAKKGIFFNTTRRKLLHIWHRLRGTDRIGTWWDRDYVQRISSEHGMSCTFFDDGSQFSTSYRFDVLLEHRR